MDYATPSTPVPTPVPTPESAPAKPPSLLPLLWQRVTGLQRWLPGLSTLRQYQSAWFLHDLTAGLVLTAILVPVGMGYAEASGLPAIHGLYATMVPLLVYALFGPSRILVLGPDSTLAAVIAALILPLAAGSVERAGVLARVDSIKGYHDTTRHPEGRHVPSLVLFRWDAQLFFANGEIFRAQAKRAIATAPTPTHRLVVVADAIIHIDITAADALLSLYQELNQQGIELWFAGLKGQVKDRLAAYGTLDVMGHDIFSPTVGSAVNLYRATHAVDWKDWDEV